MQVSPQNLRKDEVELLQIWQSYPEDQFVFECHKWACYIASIHSIYFQRNLYYLS